MVRAVFSTSLFNGLLFSSLLKTLLFNKFLFKMLLFKTLLLQTYLLSALPFRTLLLKTLPLKTFCTLLFKTDRCVVVQDVLLQNVSHTHQLVWIVQVPDQNVFVQQVAVQESRPRGRFCAGVLSPSRIPQTSGFSLPRGLFPPSGVSLAAHAIPVPPEIQSPPFFFQPSSSAFFQRPFFPFSIEVC